MDRKAMRRLAECACEGQQVLDIPLPAEESASDGVRGWLGGVRKALGTWKEKFPEGHAHLKVLAELDVAVKKALTSLAS